MLVVARPGGIKTPALAVGEIKHQPHRSRLVAPGAQLADEWVVGVDFAGLWLSSALFSSTPSRSDHQPVGVCGSSGF